MSGYEEMFPYLFLMTSLYINKFSLFTDVEQKTSDMVKFILHNILLLKVSKKRKLSNIIQDRDELVHFSVIYPHTIWFNFFMILPELRF